METIFSIKVAHLVGLYKLIFLLFGNTNQVMQNLIHILLFQRNQAFCLKTFENFRQL